MYSATVAQLSQTVVQLELLYHYPMAVEVKEDTIEDAGESFLWFDN